MKRKKIERALEETIAFLNEILKSHDVPFDVRQKAQNLRVRMSESGTKGLGSQLSLEQQIKVFLGNAEADSYPIGERRKQQIRKQIGELLDLGHTRRGNRSRKK